MPIVVVSAVNTGTDVLTATAHGLLTGDRTRVRNVGGSLPGGLTATIDLFAIRVDADNLKLASSSANAVAGTQIDVTSSGSGVTTIEYGLPYCVPRIAAPLSQSFSADANATWNALVALYGQLTGQAQTIWPVGTFWPITISPSALPASFSTNDYAPTGFASCNVVRISASAVDSLLTGIAGGTAGRIVSLVNVGSSAFPLKHDVSSTAANRFFLPNSADVTLRVNGGITLWYDGTSSRWRVIGNAA